MGWGGAFTSVVDKIVASESQRATQENYDPNAGKVADQAGQMADQYGPPAPSQADQWKAAYAAYHPAPPPDYNSYDLGALQRAAYSDQSVPGVDVGQLQQVAYQQPPQGQATMGPPNATSWMNTPAQPWSPPAQGSVGGAPADTGGGFWSGVKSGINPTDLAAAGADITSYPGQAGSSILNNLPTPGQTTLGQRIENGPGPVPQIGDFATQSAPYALTGELTIPLIAAQTALGSFLTARGVGAGDITALQGAKQLALQVAPLIAPELIKAGIHSAPAAIQWAQDFAGSPEGQKALTFLQSERGGSVGSEPPAGAGEQPLVPAGDQLPPPPESEATKLGIGEPAPALPPEQQSTEVTQPGSLQQRLDAQPTTADEALLNTTEWLRKNEKARPEQQAMFNQQRAQQLAKMGATYAADSPDAHITALQQAGGAYKRPELSPLDLSPEHEQAIRSEINTSQVFDNSGQQTQAHRALTAMQQGHLPMPADAAEFAKIAGMPFVEQLGKVAPKNWANEFIGVLGIPQTLQSTMDASALLRQMAPLGWTNPKEYFDAIGTIGRAVKSDAAALEVQHETMALPWVGEAPNAEAQTLGLAFGDLKNGRMADIGGHLHESEGQFASINQSMAQQAVEKLPWVKPSERIYNVPINRLRGQVYSKWAQNLWDSGVRDPKQYEAVAKTIDHASGWGTVVPGEIARGLNWFYAPRSLAAKFQVLLDPITQPGSLLQPSARQLAARNLVGFVAANGAMLGLMSAGGALAGSVMGIPNPVHMEFDPRSTDAFKGRIGNMRIDMTGGYGSIIRLVARLSPLAMGNAPQIKDVNGIVRDAAPADLVDTFVRGKMGPIPGAIWDAFNLPGGQGYAADFRSKEGLRTEAFNMITPFFVQDVVNAWRDQGQSGAAVAAPISFLGGGINSYQPTAASQKAGVQGQISDAGFQKIATSAWQSDQGKQIAKIIGMPYSGNTLDEYKKQYVDYWTQHADPSVPAAVAKQNAEKAFNSVPAVKKYEFQKSQAEANFWKTHVPLLKQYVDSGHAPSAEERKLLGYK